MPVNLTPVFPVATPTALPLPPTAPKQGADERNRALTSIKPLSQYPTAVLQKAITLHRGGITNAIADQLITQQAIITSLDHLRALQAQIASIERQLTREPTGSESTRHAQSHLETARATMKKERDRVVDLRVAANRYDFNIAASRVDIEKMENEIKSRGMARM